MASQCFPLQSADVREAIFGIVVLVQIYPSFSLRVELEMIRRLLLVFCVFRGYAWSTTPIRLESLKLETCKAGKPTRRANMQYTAQQLRV